MAAAQDLQEGKIFGCTIERGLKLGVNIQTLAAGKTLDDEDAPLQVLDPGGAGRTILLPPEERGLTFVIVNTADALEDLTVQEDSGTTTIGTVSQNEAALFVCDGTTWHALVGTNT